MNNLIYKKDVKETLNRALVDTVREILANSAVTGEKKETENTCPLASRFAGVFELNDRFETYLDEME